MRSLKSNEVEQISGGNFLGDIKDAASGKVEQQAKSTGIAGVCAGLVVGGLLPGATIPVALGATGFAAYAAYDQGLFNRFFKKDSAA